MLPPEVLPILLAFLRPQEWTAVAARLSPQGIQRHVKHLIKLHPALRRTSVFYGKHLISPLDPILDAAPNMVIVCALCRWYVPQSEVEDRFFVPFLLDFLDDNDWLCDAAGCENLNCVTVIVPTWVKSVKVGGRHWVRRMLACGGWFLNSKRLQVCNNCVRDVSVPGVDGLWQ